MKQTSKNKGALLRVFACVWAVIALALTCAAPAFADTAKTGSIVVNGVEASVGGKTQTEGTAYKIIDVNFDDASKTPLDPTYTWNSAVVNWVKNYNEHFVGTNNEVTETYTKLSADELKNFGETLRYAILNGDIQNVVNDGTVAASDSTLLFKDVNAGGYLISIVGSAKVYAPILANVAPKYENNAWTFENPTVEATAKSSDVTFQKKIVRDGGLYDTATGSIGSDVKFQLKANVPTYPSNAVDTTFTMIDTLSAGLTYNDGLVVKAGNKELAKDTDYTVTVAGQVVTIEFKYDSIKGASVVTAEYNATINGNAVVGTDGNPNDAKLVYSNNPYTEGSHKEIPDEVKVYTFGIEVFKLDKANQATYLKGAAFKVKDANNAEISFVKISDGVYRVATAADAENTKVTELNVGEDGNMLGKLDIKGFDAGNYKLEETKAPSGYTRLGSAVDVKLEAAKDGDEFTGHLTNDSTTKVGYVHKDVLNGKGWSLPSTGDAGIFALIAAGIMLVGGGIMVVRGRRAE